MKIVLILLAVAVAVLMVLLLWKKIGSSKSKIDDYTIKRRTHEAAITYLEESLNSPVKVQMSSPHKGTFTGSNTVKHVIKGEYGTTQTGRKSFNIEIEIGLQDGHPVMIEMKNLEK